MIRRITPFLLVLLLLATTIGPAVADTPTPEPVKKLPRQYQAVVDGQSGALEALQLDILVGMLSAGLDAYEKQTGAWPATCDALLEAGLLPFRPVDAAGAPLRIVSLGEGELPPLETIGIRMRESECTLIRMGADGDPLAPIFHPLNRMPMNNQMNWLAEYPWSARRAGVLESTVRALLEGYLTLDGRLPVSPAELQQRLQLMPSGCAWQADIAAPTDGVLFEVDAYGAHLRSTQYPDPGYEQRKTYTLSAIFSNRRLEFDPLAIATVDTWQTFGTLAWTDPVPAELREWKMPPFPEKVDLRQGRPEVPTNTANSAMLSMWSWLIDWYVPRVGATPTEEWLIGAELQLHDPLDEQGEPMTAAPSPFPMDALPPDDLGELPSNVLLYVGKDMVSQYILPTGTRHISQELLFAGASFSFRPPSANGVNQPFGTRYPGRWPPPDLALLDHAFEIASPSERRTLQDYKWNEMERSDEAFEIQYASQAGDVLSGILAMWLDADPAHEFPDAWEQLLSDVRLKARGYFTLPPEASPPKDAALIVLSMTRDRRFIRTTTELPNGMVTTRYARTMIDGPFVSARRRLNSAHDQPEIAVLDYTPITTIALTIPDPPVIPEVPAP